MMNQTKITPSLIIDIIIKRRWIILIPLCLTIVAGIYLSWTLPRVYESSTLILVQPQKVPQNYVKSVVSTDLTARISAIRQQIMSRTNLESIIKEFKLYSGPNQKDLYMEEKVAGLRKKITVEILRGWKKNNAAEAFSLTFQGTDPRRVQRVANRLASYVIDENLKQRESQAIGTSTFLDEELKMKRQRLADLELQLKSYREKYMGELPEQLDTNLRVLDRLQEQLSSKHENNRDIQQMLSMTDQQIAEEKKISASPSPAANMMFNGETLAPPTDIESMKVQLSHLRTRYTPRHPDVIRLEKAIADLQAGINAGASGPEGTIETQGKEGISKRNESEALRNLKRRRYALQSEMSNLKRERADIEAQIQEYQQRVENAPKREQELLSLRRDYENMNDSYNSLLERKLEAEISVNLEKKQKGEQFRIIDPARIPILPIKPNLKQLFMMMIILGLGIGGGIIFLLEFFKSSFKQPQDVENMLGLNVLAMVPPIRQRNYIWRQRLNIALTVLFGMFTASLVAGYACLSFLGIEESLSIARKFISI